MHGLRLFDLGHHAAARPRVIFLALRDVFRPLDEGKRDPIDADLERRLEIGAVFVDRWRRTGIVVSGRLTPLRSDNFPPTTTRVTIRSGSASETVQAHLAVVDQQRVARLDRRENFRMRKVGARCIAGRRIAVEHEAVAAFDRRPNRRRRCRGEASVPAGRSARRSAVRCRFSTARIMPTSSRMRGMDGVAHVDAENVGAGLEQAGNHFGAR